MEANLGQQIGKNTTVRLQYPNKTYRQYLYKSYLRNYKKLEKNQYKNAFAY